MSLVKLAAKVSDRFGKTSLMNFANKIRENTRPGSFKREVFMLKMENAHNNKIVDRLENLKDNKLKRIMEKRIAKNID